MRSSVFFYVMAVGLLGFSALSSGSPVRSRVVSDCSFGGVFVNENAMQAHGREHVCWQNRLSLSGMIVGRYYYFRHPLLEANTTLAEGLSLNSVNLIANFKAAPELFAHVDIADVEVERVSNNYIHQWKIDEAEIFYKKADSPLSFELGYGFANFGRIGNPYDFVRSPLAVAATNQDVHGGIGWIGQNGISGEFYLVGNEDPAWAATLGYKHRWQSPWGRVLLDAKGSVISDNKHIRSVRLLEGGTWDVDVKLLLPHGVDVGGAYIKSYQVEDGLKMWELNAGYHFDVLDYPCLLHGWYAENKLTPINLFFPELVLGGPLTPRFNLLEYNTKYLEDVFSIGLRVGLMRNFDLDLYYVNSNGQDGPTVNGHEDVSDFSLYVATLTARF